MNIIIFLLSITNLILVFIAIINTIYYRQLENLTRKRINKITPRLSDLHGKEFASYMNELNKDID